MTTDAGLAPLKRALISVSDKTGIVDFTRALIEHGVECDTPVIDANPNRGRRLAYLDEKSACACLRAANSTAYSLVTVSPTLTTPSCTIWASTPRRFLDLPSVELMNFTASMP